MIMCPKCNKFSVELIDRNEKKGTLRYQCHYCKWVETRPIDQPIITIKDIIDAGDGDKTILALPEDIGLGTKRLSPIGTSQHVIIDRRMMESAGVELGDLIHVLIWKSISKSSKEVEDHE